MSTAAFTSSPDPGAVVCLPNDSVDILEYLPFVKFIAGRVAARLPNHIEVCDLINSGVIGLIDAVEKFDSSRGIKFKTYAEFRIKGAMLDELRALDWVPRSIRIHQAALNQAVKEIEDEKLARVTPVDIANRLGISLAKVNLRLLGTIFPVVSFDSLNANNGNEEVPVLADVPEDDDFREHLLREEKFKLLNDAIKSLREKPRAIISMYYFEGMTMKEIGKRFGVTESRISQIHSEAISLLRRRCQALGLDNC